MLTSRGSLTSNSEPSMLSKQLFRSLLCISFFVTPLASLTSLETDSVNWGQRSEGFQFDNQNWNEIFCHLSNLSFEASIPNYFGTNLIDGDVQIAGEIGDESYIIATNEDEFNMDSLEQFLFSVQEAYPEYIVQAVELKNSGAEYILDLIPNSDETIDYWRFIYVNNRLIEMGTTDKNEIRRLYFFESLSVNSLN